LTIHGEEKVTVPFFDPEDSFDSQVHEFGGECAHIESHPVNSPRFRRGHLFRRLEEWGDDLLRGVPSGEKPGAKVIKQDQPHARREGDPACVPGT